MARILVDPATSDPENKNAAVEKAVLPWITDIDYVTGEITWSTAQMNQLKAAITSNIKKNDAILLAEQGDLRAAYLKGYIRINVDSDDMPNWHDIRMVIYQHQTGPLKDTILRCPAVVLRQAIMELDQQGNQLKRVEPKQVF